MTASPKLVLPTSVSPKSIEVGETVATGGSAAGANAAEGLREAVGADGDEPAWAADGEGEADWLVVGAGDPEVTVVDGDVTAVACEVAGWTPGAVGEVVVAAVPVAAVPGAAVPGAAVPGAATA